MAAQEQCLLDEIRLDLTEWTVWHLIQIEQHISAGTCPNVHPPLKDLAKEKGGLNTCLLHVCNEAQGYIGSVKKLLEVWGADVNSTSTHFLDARRSTCLALTVDRLYEVTPLFVASLKNDVELVRYLVSKGADLSARSSIKNKGPFAGITPLHGALLFDFERTGSTVVKRLKNVETIRVLLESGADPSALSSDGTPTWMFGWPCFYHHRFQYCRQAHCDVNAISLLVDHGMSLSQQCPSLCRTLLHHMAGPANEFDNVKVVNLILEKGADPRVRDKLGITPIMLAAIGNDEVPNMFVLKFLMERDDIPNMDKIEALEVAAAVLISYNTNLVHTCDIDYCLSRSQNLRLIEGIALIPNASSAGRVVEWTAPVDLEYVLQRPSEHEIQSILTRLRIFSSMSWGAVYHYLWNYIECFSHRSRERQDYAQLLDISWIMLETIQRFAPTSDATEICEIVAGVVGKLVDSLSGLKRNGSPIFNSETLQTSLKLLFSTFLAQINRFNYPGANISWILLRLFSILSDQPDAVIESIGKYLLEIVKLSEELIPSGIKLIHQACMAPRHPVHVDNTLGIIRLLLKFGANPDAVDEEGNGSLHYLAKRNGVLVEEAARLLLDSGAHFDRANKEGLTAVDVWKEERAQVNKRRRLENQLAVGWKDLPDWLQETNVPRLLCLSARVIRSHRIPYLKKSPITLHPFIEMH